MLLDLLKNLFQSKANQAKLEFDRAQSLLKVGQSEMASGILDSMLTRQPDNAAALLLRGTIKRSQNNLQAAIADLSRAQQLGADNATCNFELALCWGQLGDMDRALVHGEKARQLNPESVEAFFLLTQLRMPGDYYLEVLKRIFELLQPKTYVEIGVFEGASIGLVKSAHAVVGIDPDPKIKWELPPHMKVFKTTSDEFFVNHDLHSELGHRSVDVAFIDGMHRFENAMRDFANLEPHCRNDSVILIHDCYPVDEESAGREPRSTRWSGDVWRLIVLLKKYRPDLLVHTIGAAPTGLAVIQNLDPGSTYLRDNHDRLFSEFVKLDYTYLNEDKPKKLNFFPNHWQDIAAMLHPR